MRKQTLRPGDRVELKRDTPSHAEGHFGTVEDTNTPAQSPSAWTITVRFDGDSHLTSFPYPDGSLAKV